MDNLPIPEIKSLIYQYTVGGALFLYGLYLFFKSEAVETKSAEGIKTLLILLGGFLFFLAFHSFFHFVAPYLFQGGIK